MSNREKIARAINAEHEITLEGLLIACDMERKRIIDTTNDLHKAELIEKFRDDVTGQPAYRMTLKGDAWLINRPSDHHDAQPEVASNTGSKRGVMPTADLSASALAAEQPASDPAPAGEDADSETTRYVVMFDGEFYDSIDDAVNAVGTLGNIDSVSICEARPIGRVELRPVMVAL